MKLGDAPLTGKAPYRLTITRNGIAPIRMADLSLEEARNAWDWGLDRWPTGNFDMRDANNRRIAMLELHDLEKAP